MRYIDHPDHDLDPRAFSGDGRLYGKSRPPPPPDYRAAAQETAAGNLESARLAARANRVDQFTPYGSLTYTDLGNDRWRQDMNLTPQAQQALNQQLDLNQKYGEVANIGFDRARSIFENPQLDTSNLPQINPLNQGSLSGVRNLDTSGLNDVRGINESALGNVRNFDASGLNDVRGIDLNSLPRGAVNAGQTAQQAILSRLNPQLQQQEEALRTRLANQGITLGSDAYNREMLAQGQRANDLTTQAALQGISLDQAVRQQAFGEQQALSANDLARRQAGLSERQAMSQLDMQRQAQNLGIQQALSANDLARRQAGFGERQAMSQFDTQRQAQNLGIQQALSANDMAPRQQAFGERQAMSQFDVARRQQDLQEQLAFANNAADTRARMLQEQAYLQDRPLNLINALRTGNQVQAPQFQQFAQQATTAGPDLLNAANAQYGAAVDATNARNAQRSGMMSGLLGIGLGAAGLPVAGGGSLGGNFLGGLFR